MIRALLSLMVVVATFSACAAVKVPFKSCGSGHFTVQTIDARSWPPIIGEDFTLNVTGILDEDVTDGSYKVGVKVDGIPLPVDIGGSLASVEPLPWKMGNFAFSFTESIPSAAPPGIYSVQVSAVDQTNSALWCVALSFTESMEFVDNTGKVTPLPRPMSSRMSMKLPSQTSMSAKVTRQVRRHHKVTNLIDALRAPEQ